MIVIIRMVGEVVCCGKEGKCFRKVVMNVKEDIYFIFRFTDLRKV